MGRGLRIETTEMTTKQFDLSFSQSFPHIGSVVVQSRSVYANVWQLID